MTLDDLNNMLRGNPSRCFFIFKDDTFTSEQVEVWTPEPDGHGGTYDHGWDSSPYRYREVECFRASGWQANITM